MSNIKYSHTNLITTNWRRLSKFYTDVFGCVQTGPMRSLSGRHVEDGTNVREPVIEGVHLLLPGYEADGPTLEIFQYGSVEDHVEKSANSKGYTHIAFEVSDMSEVCAKVVRGGGWMLGKLSRQPVKGVGICTFIYVRDPDRNIIEIQSWEFL
ncbi:MULTISPECIES: VOC family protein [unclassified Pseudomonas]|uniref:VOC family protein n=1 Tax=unclassified Pseudomonas TaxID=196821 RepID=UPI002B2238F1|nr:MULTISPECIES: VOC family protein [unclassified Pseudomonas]MEA9977280.1 VOC family protein [Pseudomonas sp. RTS4]MEB0198227.1 VOC family protein [Pseudomonas sp. 5S4]MEB0247081.1 VOC family protein [Pseudomonas sp. 10S5]